MSFYIGFVMKDLIALTADRQFRQDGVHFKETKIFRMNKNLYGVHIGWKFFGEKWLKIINKMLSCFSFETSIKILRSSMWADYVIYRWLLKKYKSKLEGFTGIIVSGFENGKPFVCAMDSKDKFRPMFCQRGSIYNRIEEGKTPFDHYVKEATVAFLTIQGLEKRKDFLRTITKNIFKSLSKKYDYISRDGDLVFMTPGGSLSEEIA